MFKHRRCRSPLSVVRIGAVANQHHIAGLYQVGGFLQAAESRFFGFAIVGIIAGAGHVPGGG